MSMCSWHEPISTRRASDRDRSNHSATTRDFPIPGSPVRTPSRGEPPIASDNHRSSRRIVEARPTKLPSCRPIDVTAHPIPARTGSLGTVSLNSNGPESVARLRFPGVRARGAHQVVGFDGVRTQVSKNAPRSWPDVSSYTASRSSVVAVPSS